VFLWKEEHNMFQPTVIELKMSGIRKVRKSRKFSNFLRTPLYIPFLTNLCIINILLSLRTFYVLFEKFRSDLKISALQRTCSIHFRFGIS